MDCTALKNKIESLKQKIISQGNSLISLCQSIKLQQQANDSIIKDLDQLLSSLKEGRHQRENAHADTGADGDADVVEISDSEIDYDETEVYEDSDGASSSSATTPPSPTDRQVMLKDTDQQVASISSQMQSSTTSQWILVRSFKKMKRTTGYLGIPQPSTTEAPMTENWDDDNDIRGRFNM